MFEKLMHWMQANNVLPNISDTERQALEAGDVWIDGEFFGGRPDFRRMLDARYGRLSAEEQAFMDGPVNELLSRADCNDIALSRRVPHRPDLVFAAGGLLEGLHGGLDRVGLHVADGLILVELA